MKGLIKTSIIITVIISAGLISSVIITSNLDDQVAANRELGFEKGSSQGYDIGYYEGNKAGYQEGSKVNFETSQDTGSTDFGEAFYFTYNPTYAELQSTLAESDKTTATEINNFAEANGIRTAYVRVGIATGGSYRIVAFETVDRGFIFVRPLSHKEIKVVVNKSYSGLNNLPSPSYDDTITKITIAW